MTATVDNAIADLQRANADLRRRLFEALVERDEALEQQTATAEVLGVINSSPGDLAPVFDAMLEKAMRLCEAAFGIFHRYDGEVLHQVAVRGAPPALAEFLKAPIHQVPGGVFDRFLHGEAVYQASDLLEDEVYLAGAPGLRAIVELGGGRSYASVALRKDDAFLGGFAIYRTEVRPFTDKQIALLQNFAAQAVIAMENARLLTETREALEQQTATAEVLGVINSSPGDLAPVFDAILEKAHTLCDTVHGDLWTYDGESFDLAATHGEPGFAAWLGEQGRFRPWRSSPMERVANGEDFVHVADAAQDSAYQSQPEFLEQVKKARIGTTLFIALRKEDVLLGEIVVYRREVRPFSDKQIALLQNFAAQAVIAMENARLITETREALEQQTATAEVLGVINSSPGDLAPVFDAMLEKAHQLCGIAHGGLLLYDGESFRAASVRGYPEAFAERLRQGFNGADNPVTHPLLDGAPFVHIADLGEIDHPVPQAAAAVAGNRTGLFVPLRKDGVLLGMISAGRREVRPFTDKQIALLENFAAQAVIAMENARLITETREALEQQTATAEVLGVINSSPGDLAPVFDAILEKAMALCEAPFGNMQTYDGELVRAVAMRGVTPEFAAHLAVPRPLLPGTNHERLVRGEPFVQLEDVRQTRLYQAGTVTRTAIADLGGARTLISVPLRKDDRCLGFFHLFRQEVRLFTDKQIALLQNFAAQAVIAMENARLITETREALDQQTATAEVLQVINSSPGDLAPVFDAILEKAHALCEAPCGELQIFDGEHFRAVAVHGVPEPFAALMREPWRPPGPENPIAAILGGERLVHVVDVAAIENDDPIRRAAVELGGVRTLLVVPLRKDDALLGIIIAYRQEVRPFTDKQIALLQNFAAQAVIAMENARLITETREALDQQTATAEVLGVINSSPGDLAPVFDAMLEKAMRLCEAAFGYFQSFDGDKFDTTAMRGVPTPFAEFLTREPLRPGPLTGLGRIARGAPLVHIADLVAEDAYRLGDPVRVATVDLGGARTWLGVPLLKDDRLLGVLMVYRQEVRPFTDKQIALLQNFAAQAVIAMENARLITETREALEQQTATAEVLGVINSSPGDLAPVFDAMLDRAMRLCEARQAHLFTFDGELVHPVAARGNPQFGEWLRQQGPTRSPPGSSVDRLRLGEAFVHMLDPTKEEPYRTNPWFRELIDRAGCRTTISVPLRREDTLLGTIHLYRQEVRPFTDKQIALLQNFAAQAVIAMENARLITETREALDQQTATAEVLGVINSSPGDLAPVFDAMLEKAMRLCEATFGILWQRDGEPFRAVAHRSVPPAFAEFLADNTDCTGPGMDHAPAHLPILEGAEFVHVADATAAPGGRPDHPLREAAVTLGGMRSLLIVPLRKDDAVLGLFAIYRQEVRPFTDKQIALLQNFAAQAVIAMENARLITETREALDQQTATAEVLGVINSSPGDLAPVFDAMLEKAMRLCGAAFGLANTFDGDRFHTIAALGVPTAFAEWRKKNQPVFGPGTGPARVLAGETIVHTVDVMESEGYRSGDPDRRALVDLGGARTHLLVALRKDDALLGTLAIYRQEVRAFTAKQIALLQNFAAQAVIAMENARLITETREALEQQTATAEVLGVINSSPGDLAPVFDAMLEKAMRLCEASFGQLNTYDGSHYHTMAMRGVPAALTEFRKNNPPDYGPGTGPARVLAGERVVHLIDLKDSDPYRAGEPNRRALVDLGGARTALLVPLLKEETVLGTIMIYRQEVRAFSDKQIALLQNFAAQAVIAMENARLITETREALDQQTATAEVLGVINSSPGDLAPVFDAMLDKAMRLCEAAFGGLTSYDGERFQTLATRGLPPALSEVFSKPWTAGSGSYHQRLIDGEPLVHADLGVDDPDRRAHPQSRGIMEIGGARTGLLIALRKDEILLGSLFFYRQEVRPFTDKQIALLQNFAAQAVIATENARLLGEIRRREQELRVTFDNMADGVAMFDDAMQLAAWNRNFQELLQLSDEFLARPHGFDDYIRYLTERGEFGEIDPETQIKRLRERIGEQFSFERTRPDGKVIEVRNNPMPNGGTVVIYSDITERKRSEEEIRAARDAAEAAYRNLTEAQANLIQAQKMAALGQLTAGVAHEIKNPLNFVNNFAGLSVELLGELKMVAAPGFATLDDDTRAEIDETVAMLTSNLEKISEHGQRADNIVKSMLEHSRGGSGDRRSVNLNSLIDEALNLAYHGARAQDQAFNVALEREFAVSMTPIELVPQDITRVFLNLIGNGFYAANERRKQTDREGFVPTLKIATRDFGDVIEIAVRDNGIGIAPEIRDKLFQPFFTTKPTGEGTGLGLSISYDIVTQQHGGTIQVDSRVGEFTEFTVRLPRRYQAAT